MCKLDSFTRQYIATALWCGVTDDDMPDGNNYELDISYLAPETLVKIIADCAAFQAECDEWIAARDGIHWESAGHDFWLTRNGHGAGFWDGDWPEPYATQLTDASKRFGEVDLYTGDDGLIYQAP